MENNLKEKQKEQDTNKNTELNNNLFNDIKSFYITRDIFSLLDKKIKLGIIRYNKSLQKICEIDIDDFLKLSGRYIVFDINGEGKEYTLNEELIFKGKYSKGKRVKGTGYDKQGNIILEFNNGFGKEYFLMVN